jgi:WD40 repeat protein
MENFYKFEEIDEDKLEIPIELCKDKLTAEEYECLACSNLPIKPKTCLECEKILCVKCYQSYSQKYRHCPNCKTDLKYKDLGQRSKNLLNNLQLICINSECKTELTFENFLKHLKLCEFTRRTAICQGCSIRVESNFKAKEILEHITKCPKILRPCKYCEKQFKGDVLEDHIDFCEEKPINCEYCGIKYIKNKLDLHRRKECVEQVIKNYEEILGSLFSPKINNLDISRNSFSLMNSAKIKLNPEGLGIIQSSYNSNMNCIKIKHKCLKTINDGIGEIYALTLLKDGNIAYGTCNVIVIWDLKSDCSINFLKGHKAWVKALTCLQNGNLVSGSNDLLIKVWSFVDNYTCIATISGSTEWLNSMIPISNELIVTGDQKGKIIIWDIKSQFKPITILTSHNKAIYSLALLKNGNLASGSYDTTIKLWDYEKKLCWTTLIGHTQLVSSLLELKDGNLASASYDTTIRIWNGQENYFILKVLKNHIGLVSSIILLPDGNFASISDDKTIKFWQQNDYSEAKSVVGSDTAIRGMLSLGDGRIVTSDCNMFIKLWG